MYSEPKHNLFTDFGCLNQDTLKRLAESSLSVEEKAMVDSHVANCPFCTDAIEGISQIDSEVFDRNLFSIKFQLRQRNFTKRSYKKPVVAVLNQPKTLIYLSIAICFVLILYFMPLYISSEQKTKHLIHQKRISDSLATISLNNELKIHLLKSRLESNFSGEMNFKAVLLPDGRIWELKSEQKDKSVETWLLDQEIQLDTRGIRFNTQISLVTKNGEIIDVRLKIEEE